MAGRGRNVPDGGGGKESARGTQLMPGQSTEIPVQDTRRRRAWR